jgi:hypothetical protein
MVVRELSLAAAILPRLVSRLFVLVFVVAACASDKPGEVQVDDGKLGGECRTDAGQPKDACPPGELCYQIVKVPQLRCARDPCAALKCPGQQHCIVADSYPGEVGCASGP